MSCQLSVLRSISAIFDPTSIFLICETHIDRALVDLEVCRYIPRSDGWSPVVVYTDVCTSGGEFVLVFSGAAEN